MYWILGAEYHRRARDKNRQALRRATGGHPPPGLLALDETGAALGLCRVTPREQLAWLNTRRDLAPIDDLPVWSVPCFYVRRDARR